MVSNTTDSRTAPLWGSPLLVARRLAVTVAVLTLAGGPWIFTPVAHASPPAGEGEQAEQPAPEGEAREGGTPAQGVALLELLERLRRDLLGKIDASVPTADTDPRAVAEHLSKLSTSLPFELGAMVGQATQGIALAVGAERATQAHLVLNELRRELQNASAAELKRAAQSARALAEPSPGRLGRPARPGSAAPHVEEARATLKHIVTEKLDEATERLVDPELSTALRRQLEKEAERAPEPRDLPAFPAEFAATTGIAREVRCFWREAEARLLCQPDALLVSGEEISHIRIIGVPTHRTITVRAMTTDPAVGAGKGGRGALEPCAPSSGGGLDLSCDQNAFRPAARSGARHYGEVLIAVHKERVFSPSYCSAPGKRWWAPSDWGCSKSEALHRLRQGGREKLSLVLTSRPLAIQVGVAEGDGADRGVKAGSVPIAYRRWGFETHSFVAFSRIVDQELLRETGEDGKVKIVEIIDSDTWRQESGAFLNLVPQNYQALGLGVGVHLGSQRAPSYYFGPSVRLKALGDRAVASLSTGVALIPARRFPGVAPDMTFDAEDSRLDGRIHYQRDWYGMLSLGIRFGPLTGGGDKEGSGG